MKQLYQVGERKSYTFMVKEKDIAAFEGKVVHRVCSTFALAREIERATRQFVLDIKDNDEEGIGTRISIDHLAPAFVGEEVTIISEITVLNGNEVICSYEANVNKRIIAIGSTGQKVLKKSRIKELFHTFEK